MQDNKENKSALLELISLKIGECSMLVSVSESKESKEISSKNLENWNALKNFCDSTTNFLNKDVVENTIDLCITNSEKHHNEIVSEYCSCVNQLKKKELNNELKNSISVLKEFLSSDNG